MVDVTGRMIGRKACPFASRIGGSANQLRTLTRVHCTAGDGQGSGSYGAVPLQYGRRQEVGGSANLAVAEARIARRPECVQSAIWSWAVRRDCAWQAGERADRWVGKTQFAKERDGWEPLRDRTRRAPWGAHPLCGRDALERR